MTAGSIAFFASAKSGLGHLQRIGNIAGALRKSGFAGDLNLFSNADTQGIPDAGLCSFNRIVVTDSGRMAEVAQAAGTTLAVSDMMAVPGLGRVGRRRVLILRETPAERLDRLTLDGGGAWDWIVVPNPADHWFPARGPDFCRGVEAVGWIARPTAPRKRQETSIGVLLATGGGGSPETRAALYPVLSRIIAGARAKVPFRLRQALGPRAAGQALPDVDETLPPGSWLDVLFRKADVVISTAGYNSVLELAGTDTPALLAAIPRSYDDQQARVRKWGPLLGHGLEPGHEDAAAEWLAAQIARPLRRAPVDLGPDGAQRAAEVLARLA